MTNYAELIAEAEMWIHGRTTGETPPVKYLVLRLSDALRELAPPEGWKVVRQEYERDGFVVDSPYDGAWRVLMPNGDWVAIDGIDTFPTASAAMAALDGEK